MIRRVQFLLLMLLAHTLVGQEASYPEWFWTPPGPGWTAVFALSDREALSTGAQVLTAYSHSEVVGKYQQLYDSRLDKNTWENTDYTYNFDAGAAKASEASLVVKAMYPVLLIQKLNLYLIGPKADPTTFKEEVLEPKDLPRPKWVDDLGGTDGQPGTCLGVGKFTLEGNPGDAWIKAEESAVFNLLQARILHISQVSTETSGSSPGASAQLDWIKMHYVMGGLQVIGRWVDTENNMAEVAVTAPEKSIRELNETPAK